MAGEITEIGQIATYGGPQITLLGSTIGNALTSLYVREGSGSARSWRSFTFGKADFLNTKKILSPGDIVLLNPKQTPMDFPIQANSSDPLLPTTFNLLVDTGGDLVTELDVNTLDTKFFTLGAAAFTTGSGTVDANVNNAGYVSLSQALTAIQGLNDTAVATTGYTVQFRITRTDISTGAAVAVTATY